MIRSKIWALGCRSAGRGWERAGGWGENKIYRFLILYEYKVHYRNLNHSTGTQHSICVVTYKHMQLYTNMYHQKVQRRAESFSKNIYSNRPDVSK